MADYEDYDDYYDYEEREPAERPRDPKTDEAKAALVALFAKDPARVFYIRQLEVILEGDFFHWITVRALDELEEEGKLASEVAPLLTPIRLATLGTLPPNGGPVIRFFWVRGNRYWRRQAEAIRKLVAEFSRPEFGRALGRHGEQMFDAGLPRVGFMPVAWTVREYQGRQWTETGHNLDRVIVRDGIAYGAEIKNTLEYISREELRVKVRMCAALGVRPLFILRMAPKSYIHEVNEAGGYVLVFKWQLYPHGSEELVRRVRERLGLFVDSPAALQEGTLRRFLGWHHRTHGLPA